MAGRRQLSWMDLRVGIFVLAGIALVVIAIFYVTGAGVIGAKYDLVTYVPEVEGLAMGAPVTLDGVEVGNVKKIGLAMQQPDQPASADKSVAVTMRISRNFQDYIRSDSNASMLTQGFLGDREVTISRGYTGHILQNGETVPGVQEKSLEQLEANLNQLSTQIGDIITGVQQGKGTLGKLLVDQSLYNHLDDTLAHFDQIAASIQQGQGTLGKLVSSDQLYNQVNSITGRVDNVLEAVQEQKGTLGKLVYAPDIHDGAKQFLDNTNNILAGVREGRGTLGKLATDDSLYIAVRQTADNLSAVTSKLNSDQSSAGKLLTDPQLYDNLVGLTGDMRLLLGEFRKNPKKFLHVQFSIF